MSADPFRDRTEQSDGNYPDNWPRPSEGDYIIGEVTNIELSAGQYEQPVLGVMCEDTNKEWSVWLPKYIANDIQREDLKAGERVSIKYFGVKKSKNGREYQHYQLMVDPRSRIAVTHPDPRDEDEKRYDETHEKAFSRPGPMPEDDDDLPF